MSLDASNKELRSDQVDTVCTECYRVYKKRALLTCGSCGGKTIYVPQGEGELAKKEMQARGRNQVID